MKTTEDELRDRTHWSAVEEATELLHEERFREAMVELRRVILADPRKGRGEEGPSLR